MKKLHKFFIFAVLVFFLLGQIGRISLLGQQINIYLYEPVLLLYTVYLFYCFGIAPFKLRLAKMGGVLLGVLGASLLFSLGLFTRFDNLIALLYLLRLTMYITFFLYFYYAASIDKKLKSHIQNSLITFGITTIVVSLVQYFLYPDLRNLFYLGWDPHLFRVFGLFFDTFLSGAIYGLMALFFYFSNEGFLKNKYLKWSFFGIYFSFVFLTYSRSLYGAFLVVALFILARRSMRIAVLFTVLFIVVLVVLPKPFGEGVNLFRTYSLVSRAKDYKDAVELWSKRPVLGYGYNTIRALKLKNGLLDKKTADISHSGASFHSSFLIILVTGGIIGLIAYVSFLVTIARTSFVGGVVVVFVSLLSVSDNVFLHPFILLIVFFLITYFSSRPSHKSL